MEARNRCDVASQLPVRARASIKLAKKKKLPAPLSVGHNQQPSHRQVT